MELGDGSTDIVHPEVRAHINSLVSALGGASADDDGRYQLGDDALEVLRDIKRWIRFYDEKTNRMDVARCIHEANLIEGDLLPILATWPENAQDSQFRSKVALACYELMVPLTWPMEKDRERMTVNHHRHMPVLELAQVGYKRAIINFDGARVLHTAVRVALPAMAVPIGDRSQRDQGIIKLMLFFLRNVAMIEPPLDVKYEGDESQISRSATIDAFSYQDIFLVLLTLASNMGDDFRNEDTSVMEVIYHLVKQVDIEKLFMNEQQLSKAKAGELTNMMNKESSMLNAYNRKGPTRHNRFGTMIWVKRDDGKMSSLSGQDALADASTRNQKMDNSKTFRPPRRARKGDKNEKDLGLPAKLNSRAYDQLRSFVGDFLDSGFNPLFQHVRKTIDREATYVMDYHRRQFFYLVAWFLEAERMRRKARKQAGKNTSEDVTSFNLIAGVLNQEMFITLNKALHESLDMKDWPELTAVMRCFTQILLTVQEMSESGNEEDEEIAENVLSRLFYEESTHDAIASIIRSYKDQNFNYLDAATELVHHFLRILEGYSKQNIDMQVRSRKRTRRKKKAAQDVAGEDNDNDNDENEGSDNDAQSAERTTKERKFDFHRFATRFTPQSVVDTFVAFTKYYRDLTDAQLKRAHRYFYRVAFKAEASVMLFRVDIIHLFYSMIKGPAALDKSCSMYKEWEELVKQILRKCFKKLEQRPELLVEMLFSKGSSTAFFLEYGFERQTVTTASKAKPASELVFKNTEELDRQIAIVVGAMLDKNQADHIAWIKKILGEAESERRAFAAAEEAMASVEPAQEDSEEHPTESGPKPPPIFYVRPDDNTRRTAMFKNSHMRLLMNLVGLQLLDSASEETPESAWIIPADITADVLKDGIHYISQAEFSPPTFEEGVLAEHQLKRKAVPRKRAAFDDDEVGDQDDDMDMFGPLGPTARKAIDDDDKPKNSAKKRKPRKELTEEEKEEKRAKRREKYRKDRERHKSTKLVRREDDETDEEYDEMFFARERAAQGQDLPYKTVKSKQKRVSAPKKAAKKHAKAATESQSSEEEDESEEQSDEEGEVAGSDDDGMDDFIIRAMNNTLGEESESEEAPPDGSDGESRKRRRISVEKTQLGEDEEMSGMDKKGKDDDDDDDDDDVPAVARRRPRLQSGFVLDEDEDEDD
ncbi:replication fork protection complex subunit Tof1 Swi1 [Fusarium heterosporum]|uniref:Topoisomerase 1-associated factor 1 n=1 Tax=Fusarium heterosporum TaxID=42747 RepID=A0A8H5WDS3_FUSHE|nr:replication fork protection complex subunit Tof1 Swi1 [Fusarium heterosporum]